MVTEWIPRESKRRWWWAGGRWAGEISLQGSRGCSWHRLTGGMWERPLFCSERRAHDDKLNLVSPSYCLLFAVPRPPALVFHAFCAFPENSIHHMAVLQPTALNEIQLVALYLSNSSGMSGMLCGH